MNVIFALASTLIYVAERDWMSFIPNLFTQVDLILPGPCTLNIPPGAIAAANKEVGSQDEERFCRPVKQKEIWTLSQAYSSSKSRDC